LRASTLDIVLPCFNPLSGWEDRIISVFKELCSELPDVKLACILVNDGSVEGIGESEINKIKQSIHYLQYISYQTNRGKGYALREGVKLSSAEIVIYSDVDFPFTTASVIRIWNVLRNDETDIAAGVLNKDYYKNVPAGRRMISKCLQWMTRALLRTRISDTQRGLKGFNEKGKQIFLKTKIDRYLFDLEFIYLASKRESNCRLIPIQVELNEHVTFSKMKTAVLMQESWNFVKLFFRGVFGPE
jgi:glycosyltransferase involved in cell wall biosynthesis